jgi:hypothetical protein
MAARPLNVRGTQITEVHRGKLVQAQVAIDYENLDKTVEGANGGDVDLTPEVALGHEILGHGEGKNEPDARAYENKELRYPRGMAPRALQ